MKILLVEDDKHLRDGLAELLGLEGFKVFTANDGLVGFETYEQEQPDFCILDVMLSSLDGYSLCKKIRASNPIIPILILSARGEEFDRVLGFEAGADDYVCKPFGPRELLVRIQAIARRSTYQFNQVKEDTQHCFVMADLKVDCKALRAYRGDSSIDLTQREVLILKLLYEHAGMAVGRDELFDACWGRDFMPNSRALDQYISTLRNKLEKNNDCYSIIQTVRGVGYRYDPAK